MPSSLRKLGPVVWCVLTFLVTIPWMLPIATLLRGPHRPWVLSGHRGRRRDDNAGELHEYLVKHTKQPCIWITSNPEIYDDLRQRSVAVARRNSFAARWAMCCAPVLIYSHGESDIDFLQIFLRGVLGYRVFVHHCMNHIKVGYHNSRELERKKPLVRRVLRWATADFDLLLASSPLEQRNFQQSFPHKMDSIKLGGGAHIDSFLRGRGQPQSREIVYFPTFRDEKHSERALLSTIEAIVQNPRLKQWLLKNSYVFKIGSHINTNFAAATVSSPFYWMNPNEIKSAMFSCSIFISDYSGLIFDYLALDKAVILFPWDLEEYLRYRRLYVDYSDIAYGPIAYSVEELITCICEDTWRGEDSGQFQDKAKKLRDQIFPTLKPVYAETTYATILEQLPKQFSPARPHRSRFES